MIYLIIGVLLMAVIGTAYGRTFHRFSRTKTVVSGETLDATPDAFLFTDATNVALSSTQTSNAITVSGLSTGVSATALVTGALSSELQKNSGSWTALPVTVTNGDTIKVRHTSSASNSAAVNSTLTIGTVSDTFTSTTLAAVGSTVGQPIGLLLALTHAS